MDRREFLRTSGGIAAAAAAAGTTAAQAQGPEAAPAAPAVQSGARRLSLAMPWPDDGKGPGDSARRLSRRIEVLSQGRLRIEIAELAGRQAGAQSDSDLWHGAEHDNVLLHPAFAFFAGLPWDASLPAQELKSWLMAGGGQELWDDLSALSGTKPLLAGHTGPAHLWAARPLESLADVAGQRIHVTGLAAEAFRALGAEPVQLPAHEVRVALAAGTIAAADLGGAIASMSFGLPEVARRAYATPLTRSGTALTLHVARRVWDGMSSSDRAVLEAAAAEEFTTSLAEERAHREPIAIAMAGRCGAQYREPGGELLASMQRVGAAVVAHAAAFDAKAQRINQSYVSFARSAAVA